MSKLSLNAREQFSKTVIFIANSVLQVGRNYNQEWWWRKWLDSQESWPPGRLVYKIEGECHVAIFDHGLKLSCEVINQAVQAPPTPDEVDKAWKTTFGRERPRDAVQAYLGMKNDCVNMAQEILSKYIQVNKWQIYDIDGKCFLTFGDVNLEADELIDERFYENTDQDKAWADCVKYYEEYASYGIRKPMMIVGRNSHNEIILRQAYEYNPEEKS